MKGDSTACATVSAPSSRNAVKRTVRTVRPARALSADIRTLCERYEQVLAGAFIDGSFYHVTNDFHLDEIKQFGLQPSSKNENSNFPDLPVDDECVYLWPSIGNAQQYAHDHQERFDGAERIILQAALSKLDYAHVYPDQEALAQIWENNESFDDLDDDLQIIYEKMQEELGQDHPEFEIPQFADDVEYDYTIDLIKRLRPDTAFLLANYMANRGDALMVRKPIPGHHLQVATLNNYDDLSERFEEEHPHLQIDYDAEDWQAAQEEYDYEFDQWLAEQVNGPIITADELVEHLQRKEPDELAANEEAEFYSFTAL